MFHLYESLVSTYYVLGVFAALSSHSFSMYKKKYPNLAGDKKHFRSQNGILPLFPPLVVQLSNIPCLSFQHLISGIISSLSQPPKHKEIVVTLT